MLETLTGHIRVPLGTLVVHKGLLHVVQVLLHGPTSSGRIAGLLYLA